MSTNPTISTLILDAGPIIANTTLPSAGTYITTPSVLAELKDEAARSRLQTLYTLQTRAPRRESLEFVRTFAKKTGDSEVLSAADIGIIALTYELECEQNGGDWRLRKVPGQARINGKPPVRESSDGALKAATTDDGAHDCTDANSVTEQLANSKITDDSVTAPEDDDVPQKEPSSPHNLDTPLPSTESEIEVPVAQGNTDELQNGGAQDVESNDYGDDKDNDDDDDDEWITPANIKKHQEKDGNIDATSQDVKTMKVACATHDFALQNVLLQIGLNLVSGDGKRISSVKTWVLRCHACFKVSRKMNLKFCPSCGGATLMRTSVSTDSKGAMKVHLKRNMQWNNRGTVYSIPKQQHGTANMKGRDNLILRADQREVEKLEKRDRYKKEVDLLDPDYIPSIVSGRRDMNAASIKYGHGRRNPNSNRKH